MTPEEISRRCDEREVRGVSRTHELKCWPEHFAAVRRREKLFEVCFNDRDYRAGDTLILREWIPPERWVEQYQGDGYTGETETVTVTYVLDDPRWCKPGYVVLGLGSGAFDIQSVADQDIKTAMTRELTDERVAVAAAYWLDASPHERWEADGIILARYARYAMAEIERLQGRLNQALEALEWIRDAGTDYQSINKAHRVLQSIRGGGGE